MNRIQFFVLIGLSSLLLLLLIGQLWLGWVVGKDQMDLAQDQQTINQGEAAQKNLKQVALRIYQDSQKTQDQSLKDILIRQQVTVNAGTENTNNANIPLAPK